MVDEKTQEQLKAMADYFEARKAVQKYLDSVAANNKDFPLTNVVNDVLDASFMAHGRFEGYFSLLPNEFKEDHMEEFLEALKHFGLFVRIIRKLDKDAAEYLNAHVKANPNGEAFKC